MANSAYFLLLPRQKLGVEHERQLSELRRQVVKKRGEVEGHGDGQIMVVEV